MSNLDIDTYLTYGLAILPRGCIPLKRKLSAQFWAMLIAATLMVFSVSFIVLQHRCAEGERRLSQVKAKHTQLYLKMMDLEEEMKYVQTDDYIERSARDDLGLIMPNEYRYISGG